MKTIYLSLGSNVGDRAENITRAIEALAARGVRVTRQSSLYETEPVNMRGGGWFLNGAVEAETELMPRQLIEGLLAIERSLGRVRRADAAATDGAESAEQNLKEPRTIDIDILLFGASVVDAPGLSIPHPRMAERRFVLAPLAEIAPDARHPISRESIAELLAGTPDRSQVRLWRGNPPA
jgi:2-amino-4-hydroxy-6-hydroxymethyldihydropteridine diphosphokinase